MRHAGANDLEARGRTRRKMCADFGIATLGVFTYAFRVDHFDTLRFEGKVLSLLGVA